MRSLSIAFLFLALSLSVASASGLEPEEALAMDRPYCVDMRIEPERRRAKGKITPDALSAHFGCRRLFVLPMSVIDDSAMMERYAKRFATFKGHDVLVWCTHGVRSERLATALQDTVPGFRHLKGGTNYLETVFRVDN